MHDVADGGYQIAVDVMEMSAHVNQVVLISGDSVMRIGETDTWADIAEYEHAHGFGSLPGGAEADRRERGRPQRRRCFRRRRSRSHPTADQSTCT